MDLQQVKQDLDKGVFVTKETWGRVLEAALMLELVAIDIGADDVLEAVEAL